MFYKCWNSPIIRITKELGEIMKLVIGLVACIL
jgi:hypothetical protein